MKKIKLFTALLAVVLVAGMTIFYACKKEDKINELPAKAAAPNPLETLYSQLPTPDFGNIKLVNGDILQFESVEHYEQVYEALEAQCEAWMALFLQKYDTGDEEALDAIIEQLKFDENLPLKKFEQKYKKTDNTLLWSLSQKEETWLERGGEGGVPEDEITPCPIELALLSKYHEYCIGNTICQWRPNSCELHIPTSKTSMLNQIRNTSVEDLLSYSKEVPNPSGPVYIPEPFNITVYPPKNPDTGGGSDCGCDFCYCTEYKKSFTKLNGTDHKFTLSYHFRHDFYKGKAKTTVTSKNYKLKKGSWKNDYSSYCRLGFSTKLYQNPSITQCIDKGRDGKTSNLAQAFSKSKRKTFNFDYKTVTDQIFESYVTYRHKGVEFKFNPRGEVVP